MGGYENLNEVLAQWAAGIKKDLEYNIDNRSSSRGKSRGNSRGLNATGRLRSSLTLDITTGDTFTNLKLGWNKEDVDYASAVETGRKAGKQPPIADIEKWITDKGIDVRAFKKPAAKRKGLKSKPYDVLKARKSLAFIIARRIGRYGTEPTHFWSDVVNVRSFDNLRSALKAAVKKDILIELKK